LVRNGEIQPIDECRFGVVNPHIPLPTGSRPAHGLDFAAFSPAFVKEQL
jgi:hypothetical protein